MPDRDIKSLFRKCFRARPALILTDLPENIIHDILSQLPQHDRISLRLTCRKVNTANRPLLGQDRGLVPYVYLWQLSLHLPETWLCVSCRRLHRLSELDTPNAPNPQVCTRAICNSNSSPAEHQHQQHQHDGIVIRAGDTVAYHLRYQHVHTALKWLRLGIHPAHLSRLLSAHRSSHATWYGAKHCSLNVGAWPRIKNGKFLLKKEFNYRLIEPVPYPFWEMDICPHQQYTRERYRGWAYWDQRGLASGNGLLPHFAVCKAVKEAIARQGFDIYSSCSICRTDFCVRLDTWTHQDSVATSSRPDANKVNLRGGRVLVWHDLGGECSPVQPEWTSQSLPTWELVGRNLFRYEKPDSSIPTDLSTCGRIIRWKQAPSGTTKEGKKGRGAVFIFRVHMSIVLDAKSRT
ncbi:hypothetical protein E4U55_001766 [Claviceps digitariae]|nr:hypothetical protein E4U55_001766 [Claviceps digitariae]